MRIDLIVLLHGAAGHGRDLRAVAEFLLEANPHALIALPDGPFSSDTGSGFQWLSMKTNADEISLEQIEVARKGFDTLLDDLCRQLHVVPERDRIVLAGFSQGATIALDSFLRKGNIYSSVVVFSGRIAIANQINSVADSAALFIHGKADPVIDVFETIKTAELLRKAGIDVELHLEENIQHAITIAGVKAAAKFIQKQLSAI